jgi:NitT/TauT family transport system substrate-binding protein
MRIHHVALAVLAVVGAVAGLGGLSVGGRSEGAAEGAALQGKTKVKLALNWKPEPEFGGFYTAAMTGGYAKAGLDVDIMPGGSGTPTVQMVDNGRAEFGIVSADEVVLSRARGGDVVALFAIYQKNPMAVMTHAERPASSLKELIESPGRIWLGRGQLYVAHLKKMYDFSKVTEVPYTGGLPIADRADGAQQCFVFSEPVNAAQKGIKVKTFLVAECGYNPYSGVIVTSGKFLREHADVCRAFIDASRAGWSEYQKDPGATNAEIGKLNPVMDSATLVAAAESQKPLIEDEFTAKAGLGAMTLERWKTLIEQMTKAGQLDKPVKAEECFSEMKE